MSILLLTPEESFLPYLESVVENVSIDRQWNDAWTDAAATDVVRLFESHPASVVMVGPTVDEGLALELMGAFDNERPELELVIIAEATQELLMGAMRLGVREIVPPNAPPAQISEAVNRVLGAATRLQSAIPAATEVADNGIPTKVITVLSAKGGTGKTVAATNLALGLANQGGLSVCLVDLDIQFGDCSSALNLEPQQTLADAAASADRLDVTTLKVFLTPHPSGLFLLAPPQSLVDAAEITPQQVKSILNMLTDIFDVVIIDTAPGIDDNAITAMEFSTDLLLVCSSEVPSVRAMRRQVETLDTVGLTKQKRHFLINRAGTRVGLRTNDIEQTVGLAATIEVPSSRQVVMATNQGNPVLVNSNRDPAARALQELVDIFLPEEMNSGKKRKGKR